MNSRTACGSTTARCLSTSSPSAVPRTQAIPARWDTTLTGGCDGSFASDPFNVVCAKSTFPQGGIVVESQPNRRYNSLHKGVFSIPFSRTHCGLTMAKTLEHWIDSLQARGRYSFLRQEAVADSGLSAEAVKKALQRLDRRQRVAKIKDYFYAIVPLEYQTAGAPPATWFIGELMGAMKLPYYVGLLSAAAMHGASHQQPQEFQVVTDRSVRSLTAGRATIRFFASKYIPRAATQEMKTPTGRLKVATPETTAVDLVRFSKSAGNLDNVATLISELVPLLNPRRLLAAVYNVGDVPNAQRLGHVLDRLRRRDLSGPIHEWVERHHPRLVKLRSTLPAGGADEDRRWHLLVNRPVEIEA
jgi:predicted transcriptional regulator of viral defense system